MGRAGHRAQPPVTFRLDLAALAGPGFDEGPWRLGGQLRSSLALSRLPVLFWVALSGSRRDGEVSANWWSGHGGAGLHFASGIPLIDIEGRLGGAGSWVLVSASDESGHDEEAAWRWGMVGSLDIVVEASQNLHMVLCTQVTATWPMLDVVKGPEEEVVVVGREPTARWAAVAGLRWAP